MLSLLMTNCFNSIDDTYFSSPVRQRCPPTSANNFFEYTIMGHEILAHLRVWDKDEVQAN